MRISEEEIKDTAKQLGIRQMAAAFIKRGKNAGIPDRYLRINKDSFEELLNGSYHPDSGDFSDFVYSKPLDVMKLPYIVIDGGDHGARSRAAFGILFRLITCDKDGHYISCDQLSHKLQDFNSDGKQSRNELVDFLKKQDVLYIGEVSESPFSPHLDSKGFIDEILSYRYDYMLPTILSFKKSVGQHNKLQASLVGTFLSILSTREFASKDKSNPSKNMLRVRVDTSI